MVGFRSLRVGVVAALFLCIPCIGGMVNPARSQTLSFNQLSWLSQTSGYVAQYSDWGVANIGLSSGDAGLFVPVLSGYGGYVNIVTRLSAGDPDNWAVQNLPIFFKSPSVLNGRLPESVNFDLTSLTGSPVSSLEYFITIDAAPLPSAPSGAFTSTGVANLDILKGGVASFGSTGQGAPVAAKNFMGVSAGGSMGASAASAGDETDIPDVSEETNHCAPGSVARSLRYMANIHPEITVPGDVQDIYDTLKDADHMMTSTKDGTEVSKILSGKNKYVEDKGLPIVTIQTTSFTTAITTLQNEGDVELFVFYGTNGKGESLGGHSTFVSEIIEKKNAMGDVTGYSVKTIDDPKQGDGIAGSMTTVYCFNSDGTLGGYGDGASLIGFQVENVPEPGTYAFFGIAASGLAGLIVRARRKTARA